METNQKKRIPSDSYENGKYSVKKILLEGVFWRILIIEGILLVWSLTYKGLTDYEGFADLLWYSVRIIFLITIIIGFMMVTLRSFLTRKIISPLEAIALANRRFQDNDPEAKHVDLPGDASKEIKEIVTSRTQMLDTILKVSEERLHLVNFIKDTFGRYYSKKVVDEILESPEGQKIGGQKKIVTILMSDLRGFTSLSEIKDPEEMVKILNRYLERMTRVILEYDGIIDEFIGDAILAVFGVPEKRDDDPFRAVACGLAMQNALLELNEENIQEGYPSLEMGIGINTGSVIVGNIGSEMRVKYGIVGSTVNIAARIESNTIGGQVLIGEDTYNKVKEMIVVESPLTAMMKGVKKPLVSFPVTAIEAPYSVSLNIRAGVENGIEIRLPFHFWKVENKKITGDSKQGVTMKMNENMIIVSIRPPLEPLVNIKLIFDFCTEAHCFEDIYAKVMSVEKYKDETVNQINITSISPKDRDILLKWISEAS